MVEQDFSRIGEIFYREVGEEEQVSLEGFIKKALTVYAQKHLFKEVFEEVKPKKVIFPSSRGNLSFIVKPYRDLPDMSSLEIISKVEDVKELLYILRGDVTAEFLGLDLKTCDEDLRKKILKAKKKDYAQLGNISFCFSLDPKTPDMLKRLSWKRVKSISFDEEVFYSTEGIDESLTPILLQADHLRIEHSFYINNNPTMGLIKESCEIKQPSKKDYRFVYNISANDKTLPAGILKHLGQVFEIVRQDFNQLSYQRMKIEDINSFVGAYA